MLGFYMVIYAFFWTHSATDMCECRFWVPLSSQIGCQLSWRLTNRVKSSSAHCGGFSCVPRLLSSCWREKIQPWLIHQYLAVRTTKEKANGSVRRTWQRRGPRRRRRDKEIDWRGKKSRVKERKEEDPALTYRFLITDPPLFMRYYYKQGLC